MKKIMVSLILCLACMFSLTTVNAENSEYSLLNDSYVRLLGRGEVIDGSRTFNWPNAGFEFEFSGNTADVYVDVSSYDASGRYVGNYFNMAVYNGDELVRTERMKLVAGWNRVYTYSDGDPQEKTIMLVRSSEACKGTLRMSKLRTDEKPEATMPKQKHIEFIGDSYTAGYGNSKNLSDAEEYCAQNTDNWNSYTGMVARHYGADNTVIAHQGMGVYANRSIQRTADNMAEQFNYSEIVPSIGGVAVDKINMSTRKTHDFSSYQPDLVSVWLGTNDEAAALDIETFAVKYKAHLDNIRSKYPEASILCVSLKGSKYHDTIKGIVDSLGASRRYYMLTLESFKTTSFSHPDIEEHERIANQFISKIDSIPGIWGTTGTPVNTELLSLTVDYNTNTVTVEGKTPEAFEKVSAIVLKPGKKAPEVTKDSTVYYNQTNSDKECKYGFRFEVDKLAGEYTYYMNTDISESFSEREFSFKNYIPMLYAEKNEVKITKISELSAGDTITAVISGFEHEEGFEGVIAVAQYQQGRLKCVDMADASANTIDFGTEIKHNTVILNGTDSVKLIYMNKINSAPLIGAYTIF